MAEVKWTELTTTNTDPLLTDQMIIVDDPGGSSASQKITMATLQGLMAAGMYPGGRLTLTTATPVTTADVTGATTLYYTPYIHDNIRLYDGTSWRTVAFTEKSITMAGATSSKPYDVWGYLSSGTLALEKLIWTDGTTRATALAYQNGRLVKNGDATRLYLGTVYCNSSGGQTDDSITKRFVWNNYNRKPARLRIRETTSHQYTTASWRAWNNTTTGAMVEFVTGYSEDSISANVTTALKFYTNAVPYVNIGLDSSTSALSPENINLNTLSNNAQLDGLTLALFATPGVGYHYLAVMEYGSATSADYLSVLIDACVYH